MNANAWSACARCTRFHASFRRSAQELEEFLSVEESEDVPDGVARGQPVHGKHFGEVDVGIRVIAHARRGAALIAPVVLQTPHQRHHGGILRGQFSIFRRGAPQIERRDGKYAVGLLSRTQRGKRPAGTHMIHEVLLRIFQVRVNLRLRERSRLLHR